MERHLVSADPRRTDAGYTMVMFVIILALMAIMMGAAVQSVAFQMQREREAELVFRGEQYMEAIRRHAPDADPPVRIERFAFYDRAKGAFAIVMTGETRKYGNIILRKGVTT